jgi:hypothetical protein
MVARPTDSMQSAALAVRTGPATSGILAPRTRTTSTAAAYSVKICDEPVEPDLVDVERDEGGEPGEADEGEPEDAAGDERGGVEQARRAGGLGVPANRGPPRQDGGHQADERSDDPHRVVAVLPSTRSPSAGPRARPP